MYRKSFESSRVYKVSDPSGVLGNYFLGFTGYFFGLLIWLVGTLMGFWITSFLLGFPLVYLGRLFFRAAKNKREGYVLDMEERIFSFPSGRIADDVENYFSLSWWNQRLGAARDEISIDEISSVEASDRQVYIQNSGWRTFGALKIQCSDGSFELEFGAVGKRDQLYALLIENLELGSPVVVR